MNKKVLTISITLVLTLIIIGVVFVLQKREVKAPALENKQVEVKIDEEKKEITSTTTKETATTTEDNPEIDISNWKTYRNESCGFEILIPKEWLVNSDLDCDKYKNIKPESVNEGYLGINFYNPEGPLKGQPIPFDISIAPFKGYTKKEIEKKTQLDKYINKEYMKNNFNINVYYYTCSSSMNICNYESFLLFNSESKRIFLIKSLISIYSQSYPYYKSIIDKIIESFRFLD